MRRTLVATSLGTLVTAVVGALGTDPDSSWYRSQAKPPWQPPPVAFPLVWTPLYAAIAWGTARLLDAEPDPARRRRLGALVAADLVANAGWCWAFFKGRSPRNGLAVIAVLDGLNLALVDQARRRDGRAAAALAPYAAWGLFASALNADIWRRNR
ncbi:TspO/MBR family protein [Oryzihumus sp.]|uniref:TspO/MBR family protein n=1 Tax=Oryzihumus sp. TaxID=1968903 RepID=UPI002ED8B73C